MTQKLQKELENFRDLISDYLTNPNENKILAINKLHKKLSNQLPNKSAQKRAIDSLKNLIN